jgi:predicted DsbA family dithiol-disulfide isomerase
VRSTPTFFLNGLPIVGAQPYEVFQDVIEKELAGEIPK